MSIQKRIFTACTHSAKTGESVILDGVALSAFRYVRREVERFNAANPPWECYVEKQAGNLVVECLEIEHDQTLIADDLKAVTSLRIGGDFDVVARRFYDLAVKNDVALVDEPLSRKRAEDAVKLWNDQKLGDVVVRKWRGSLIFYRRKWLGGRKIDSAMSIWRACQ